MNITERLSMTIRHTPGLARVHWLWNLIRPIYNQYLCLIGHKGLKRVINGTDPMLIAPKARGVTEHYEPEFWQEMMSQVRPGDMVADVGAFIGLYTIALAKRVGETGRVTAFEPSPENYQLLKDHVTLNGVSSWVEPINAAVGLQDGTIPFELQGIESHISTNSTQNIRCVCLDTVFANQRLDILKIDVEGYEEYVLRGATSLLNHPTHAPRIIYIEVHPYAWKVFGVSSESLLSLLNHHYQVFDLEGATVSHISEYGDIIARRRSVLTASE